MPNHCMPFIASKLTSQISLLKILSRDINGLWVRFGCEYHYWGKPKNTQHISGHISITGTRKQKTLGN